MTLDFSNLLAAMLDRIYRCFDRRKASDRRVLQEFHRLALPAIDIAGRRRPPTSADRDKLLAVCNDLTTLVRQYAITSKPFESHVEEIRGTIYRAADEARLCLNPGGSASHGEYFQQLMRLDEAWFQFNCEFAGAHGYSND